jgi:predicted membrane protein
VRWNSPDPEVETLAVSMLLTSIFIITFPVVFIAWIVKRWTKVDEKKVERKQFKVGDLVRIKDVKDPMFKTRWDGRVGVVTRKWEDMDLYLVTFTDNTSGKNFASFKWFDLDAVDDK